ncbi:MAG: hypothetical protein HUJ80_01670 [Firmicutes bacterium]|nr:hypothetical protein [Bacillota bacterium]
MIRIHEIKLKAGQSEELLSARAERKLGLQKGSLQAVRIVKESLDAREKPQVYRVFSLDLITDLSDEVLLKAAAAKKVKAQIAEELSYTPAPCLRVFETRPVVCGFGPCGIFAALVLALYGAKPIVLERGACMEKRIEAVESFWRDGILSPVTNVQFGEGGAGTFSDGKLTTGTKDAAQRFVLQTFADAGASPSILYKNKPHIGTDVLRRVVVNIRKKIEALGGEVRFESEMTSLDIAQNRVCGLWVNEREYIKTDTVILALGHSARNTVRSLFEQGLRFEQKPFSMGVRIEHPQDLIDRAQLGASAGELGLMAADYKLNVKTKDGRGVYTFCMCPGGYVVAAASQEGGVVTNGMSNSDRGGSNANAALLVDVRTDDFPSDHPLSGIQLQETYEKRCYEAAGACYKAPCQTVGAFLGGHGRADGNASKAGAVAATYRPGVVTTDLRQCLPAFVCDAIAEALPLLDRKLHGFAMDGALMTAPETRSSAPFRMRRDEEGRVLNVLEQPIEGLYAGGEGAGYAGGIMSAAVDGLHLAEKAAKENRKPFRS